SNPSLQYIGENTTYEDINPDDSSLYYANFRDAVLVGNTLYMTLENQGIIVTITDTTLSNEDLQFSNNLKVYPNPVKDIVHIEMPNNDIKNVELYNLKGQKLNTFDYGFEHISVGHLSEGVYIFKVTSNNGKTQVLKLVKE